MVTLLTTKNDLVAKTAATSKIASSMTGPFPQAQKFLSYARRESFAKESNPFSTSAGKVQFAGIIMSHERKTHAKRRSKMKFNF